MILQMVTTLCLVVASTCLGGKLKDLSCQEQFRNVLLLFLSLLEMFESRKEQVNCDRFFPVYVFVVFQAFHRLIPKHQHLFHSRSD